MKQILIMFILVMSLVSCDSSNESKIRKKLPPITGTPLLWGFDNAGYVPSPQLEEEILRDFGFDLVVYHYTPQKSGNEFALKRLSNFYAEHKVQWILNLESANWVDMFFDDMGRDWYNHPDGRHYFMFPDEVLEYLSSLSHKPGIMYDEAAHMQNSRNHEVNKPFLMKEGDVQSLEGASDAFTQKAREIADKYQNYGLEVYCEHVFPVQFHTLADAGFIPVSKVLKENNTPAYIACALGAAIQYNKPFWLTPDLWFIENYPGHTPDEYKSALLLAYHMGAEGIYTENLGYDGYGNYGTGKGSLIKVDVEGNSYQMTEWGEIAKWFRWEYAPNNPRNYKFDELIPKVAIVRQEDACWGQSASWLKDELFGIEGWKSTSTTEAWLEVWNLLSNGQINQNSISWHNSTYSNVPYQVFYPLDGVVVFDEKVDSQYLTDVELIFLTGIGISDSTLSNVKVRVQQGAVCVSLPQLAPGEIISQTGNNGSVNDGQGKWIVSESFLSNKVKQAVQPYLPKENYIRYQFGNTEVRFRPINGNNDKIKVEVISSSSIH
jgi:hypothetical protein